MQWLSARSVPKIVFACLAIAIAVLLLFGYLLSLDNPYDPRNCPDVDEPRPAQRIGHAMPGGGAVALAIGGDKSCALMKDGRVWCWGDEQLELKFAVGSGSHEPLDLPPKLLDTFLAEASDRPSLLSHEPSGYTCGAFGTKARCWDIAHPNAPQPGGAGRFVKLWTGGHSACGETDTGAVSCWGTGEPWLEPRESFGSTRIVGLDGADEVAMCATMVCARRGTSVECTPARQLEELRAGTRGDGGRIGVAAARISCCTSEACALTAARDIACWSTTFEPVMLPKRVGELGEGPLCGPSARDDESNHSGRKVTSADLNCWVETDGRVTCTAVPAASGVELDLATPHALPGVTRAKDAFVDRYEWCVQTEENAWNCWPRLSELVHVNNSEARLGVSTPPEPVKESEGTTKIAQNRFALCLTDDAFHARCRERSPPGKLGREIEISDAQKLSIGNNHACVLDTAGSLACWGANESGEVLPKSRSTFVEAPAHVMDDVADVAVGLRHTCAALRDGSLVCFGDNHYGQLGNGGDETSPGIVRVASLTEQVTRLAAGFDHTCALTALWSVYCWGSDSTDARGAPQIVSVPAKIDGLSGDARSIAAARDASCALLADGSATCWGRGLFGETKELRPRPVKGAEGSVELGMGDRHACVRSAAGRVRCFGSDDFGQLAANLPIRRVEVQPPRSCPSVTYTQEVISASAVDVVW